MKAYEILSQPDAWTKGRYAETRNGDTCNPRSETAVRWCMLGAIDRAMEEQPDCAYRNAVMKVATYLREALHVQVIADKTNIISHWNDAPERTAEDVIDVLRKLDL